MFYVCICMLKTLDTWRCCLLSTIITLACNQQKKKQQKPLNTVVILLLKTDRFSMKNYYLII